MASVVKRTGESFSLPRIFLAADKYRMAVVGLSVAAGIAAFLVLRQYGSGYNSDSANYFSAATHLATGRGLTQYDGNPYTLWPPLYPLVLAAIQWIAGITPIVAAPLVNSILLGLTIFLAGRVFFKHLKSRLLAAVGTIAAAVSGVLVWNAFMGLSDMLCLTLALAYLFCFEEYRASSRRGWLVAAGVMAALTALSRYIGVFLVPVGVCHVLLFTTGEWKSKLMRIVAFGLIASVPLLLWDLYVYQITGHSLGTGGAPNSTLPMSLAAAFNTILAWFIPRADVPVLRNFPLVGVWYGTWEWTQYIQFAGYVPFLLLGIENAVLLGFALDRPRAKLREYWNTNGDLLVFIFVYLVTLIYLSVAKTIDPPENRYLSPIYVPLLVALLALFESSAEALTRRIPARVVTGALGLAVAVWLLYPAGITRSLVTNYWMEEGWGTGSAEWTNSRTIKYVVHHRDTLGECVVYSNGADALYLLANFESKFVPDASWTEYIQTNGTLPRVSTDNPICIVWLNAELRPWLVSLDTLSSLKNLQTLQKFSDGGVYAVSQP